MRTYSSSSNQQCPFSTVRSALSRFRRRCSLRKTATGSCRLIWSRDGKESLLRGFVLFGFYQMYVRVPFGSRFFPNTQHLVRFAFGFHIHCFEFDLDLCGFGVLTVLNFPQLLLKHLTQNYCDMVFL